MTLSNAQPANKPLLLRVLPDILAFGIGLGAAYFLQWETTDLVWSLWLCSLVIGYITILAAIGGGAYVGLHLVKQESFDKKFRLPAIGGGLAIGLFLLGFFSLHFCGFHAGHSVFLAMFFPVEGLPEDGFGAAFMNPPLLWALVFEHLIKPSAIFLVAALIAERKHIFQPIARARSAIQSGINVDGIASKRLERNPDGVKNQFGDVFSRPYVNVMRMHMLIFFFAFCHFMELESFFIYVVVYSVYFFPWKEFKSQSA